MEIRDLNEEIERRTERLRTLHELCVVSSSKKGKLYGLGFNDPEHDLILVNFQRLLACLFRPKPPTGLSTTVIITDIINAARNVVFVSSNSTSEITIFANFTGGGVYDAQYGAELAFGNPATAPTPTRTDYELASLVVRFTPSGTISDEILYRVTVTGSYVWAAGGTVREAGLSEQFFDTSTGAWRKFLMCHDGVSDVPVPVGGTVSVTYSFAL